MTILTKNGLILTALCLIFSIFNIYIGRSSGDNFTSLSFISRIANAQYETEPRLCDCGKDKYNYDDLYLLLTCICSYNQYDCCACCKYM